MPSPLTFTAVRVADAADLDLLAEVEQRSGRTLAAALSGPQRQVSFGACPSGRERAARPGVVLVAGEPVCGFAHLIHEPLPTAEVAWHLEELAVAPQRQRQGIGTCLLRAAMGWALDRGGRELSLTTYRDVAFNAPFYSRHGFTEIDASERAYLHRIRMREIGVGLDAYGSRVAMLAPLRDAPVPIPAVSVIPLRDGAGVRGRPGELEAFVQYRVSTMDFAAGAVVFPGGRIDPADHLAPPPLPARPLAGHAERWQATSAGSDPARAAVLVTAGLRELAEEAGVAADPRALVPWDNWITPIAVPRRFDVHFFVLPVEDGGRDFRNTTTEAEVSEWVPLRALAERAETGQVLLLPPTRTIVGELLRFGGLSDVLAAQPAIAAVRHDIAGRRPRTPAASS